MNKKTEVIYCSSGNYAFADLAIRYGLTYGARVPDTLYRHPEFTDQDWRKPDRSGYMEALKKIRPRLATVLDWEREDQFDEVMSWADQAAEFVSESVIIIPKVMGGAIRIPDRVRGIPIRLGYSVPTRYGGTELPLWEFHNRPVHLLGGHPKKQYQIASYLDVHSVDTNYMQRAAISRGQFFAASGLASATNTYFPMLKESAFGDIGQDVPYFAFELSCMNMVSMWAGGSSLRWAVLDDIQAIQKIAGYYRNELGRVMRPSLEESVARRTLIVSFAQDGSITGFCNFRRRRDGVSVIYELAVEKSRRGTGIGSGILACIQRPVRLKCTVDNLRANTFYENRGMKCVAVEPGRLRPLNVWELA